MKLPEVTPEQWDPVGYSDAKKALLKLDAESADHKQAQAELERLFEQLPKEHQLVLTGEQTLNDALIAFTKRVYSEWLRPDDTGMSVAEIPDKTLRDEWVKFRKRLRANDMELPKDCRVPSQPERNQELIKQINAGERSIPSNPKFYLVLKQAASRKGIVLEATNTDRAI